MRFVSWSSGFGIPTWYGYQNGNIRSDASRNFVERESETKIVFHLFVIIKCISSFITLLSKVDVFLVVLGLILILFAALYHIMLVGESLEDDEWSSFQDSLWKVWGYAVGEIDDTAFPTTSSYLLFTAFALTIVIIMMVRCFYTIIYTFSFISHFLSIFVALLVAIEYFDCYCF